MKTLMALLMPVLLFWGFCPFQTISANTDDTSPLKVDLTCGPSGAVHSASYLVGESVFMKVTITGLRIPEKNSCHLSVRHYIVNKDDKVLASHREDDVTAYLDVGQLDAKVQLFFPVSSIIDSGEHTLVTEIRVRESGKTFVNRQRIHFIPTHEFAISNICFTSADDRNVVLCSSFEVTQNVLLNWFVQGPKVDNGAPWRFTYNVKIYDKNGVDVGRKREPIVVEKQPSSRQLAKLNSEICITTAGDYFFEIEVKDLQSDKVLKQALPFRVVGSLADFPH